MATHRERVTDSAPHTVDMRLVGLCQLRCAWCWGPEHLRTGSVSADEWQRIIAKLYRRGTKQIVIGGGEPTLSKALRPCVTTAKELGLKVTLSSNGIGLAAFEDVLTLIDDLGIPIDGSTPAMNDRMRDRSLRHEAWDKAINAIVLTQGLASSGRSQAQVTIRTVIARPTSATSRGSPTPFATRASTSGPPGSRCTKLSRSDLTSRTSTSTPNGL